MKVLNEKFILKCAAEGLVPTSIRSRTKQPYRAPDARSFFPDAGKPSPYEYVEELLSPADIESTGVFSAPAVRRLTAKATSRTYYWRSRQHGSGRNSLHPASSA